MNANNPKKYVEVRIGLVYPYKLCVFSGIKALNYVFHWHYKLLFFPSLLLGIL